MNPLKILIVTTAVESPEKANDIARRLVKARLFACVQVFPINSHYTWKEEIMEEKECLIQGKTVVSLFDDIKVWMQKNHPYEEAELIGIPVDYISESYAKWVIKSCQRPK